MERQHHGFLFEQKYINENNLIKAVSYTEPFDAYSVDGVPYQIKTIKSGQSIDLGDYFINSNKTTDFILVIGFWQTDKTNIINVYKIHIDCEKWNELLSFDYKDSLKHWIKNISNERSFDDIWKEEVNKWKLLYGNNKRLIKLRFKRDHKSQKRIQCAINKADFNKILGMFSYEQIRS